MRSNLGIWEQALRFLIGIGIIAYSYINLCCTNLVLGLIIGMFFLATGGIGYCPICNLFNRKREKPDFKLKKGKTI